MEKNFFFYSLASKRNGRTVASVCVCRFIPFIRHSSSFGKKPPENGMTPMKMTLVFLRRRTKRQPPTTHAPLNDWAMRDWADLPTHHPKRD